MKKHPFLFSVEIKLPFIIISSMRMITIRSYTAVLALLLLFPGCAGKEFGNRISISSTTSVYQLKKYPENYLNKVVKIRGKVVEESGKGLWVNIQDNYIVIMVNFMEGSIELPPILRKNVEIIGKFVRTKDGYMLMGRYLKIL